MTRFCSVCTQTSRPGTDARHLHADQTQRRPSTPHQAQGRESGHRQPAAHQTREFSLTRRHLTHLFIKSPPKKQIKWCAVCALSKMFSLIHGCNFLLTGQTCAPAYPWLRGRGHETANGVAGTGNTKVGGSDRLRSLRTWLHHHRCQTAARSYCKAKGEGGGGEETRSGCTDRRRERRGGDGVSKEGEIRLLSWDKGREIASGIFFFLHHTKPVQKKNKTLAAEDTRGEKEGEVLLIFSPQRLFLYCRCFLKPQMSFNHRTVL